MPLLSCSNQQHYSDLTGNSADEILEGLMEADVDVRDVEEEDGEITVYADQDQFHAVQTALNEMGITRIRSC